MIDKPVIPDYAGACISNIIPAILEHEVIGEGWIPDEILKAKKVILLLIDGLGFEQFENSEEKGLVPNLTTFSKRRIHTVAPTTTATALTSLTTGKSPGEHGVVGYKIRTGNQILNALRWTTGHGSAVNEINPASFQPVEPFFGSAPPIVSPAQFHESGFSSAHLRGGDYLGYWLPSSMPVLINDSLNSGANFVYSYYDGLDKVGHIHGINDFYDAEVRFIDDLIGKILACVPNGTALIVTADHGLVDVDDSLVTLETAATDLATALSGEARFLWFHSKRGAEAELVEILEQLYSQNGWIRTRDQVLDEGWFGKQVSTIANSRLGDVALVARNPVAFVPAGKEGPKLKARHGSLTPAESYVPLMTMLKA